MGDLIPDVQVNGGSIESFTAPISMRSSAMRFACGMSSIEYKVLSIEYLGYSHTL